MKVTGSDAVPQKPRKKPGRAPVSCAECRRLKMKCDRGNPCENCTKRGCALICPDGTLTTGKHNKYRLKYRSHDLLSDMQCIRMILSNTEELHDKIESLLERIRLLEDALRTLQASVSTQPHPLLAAPTTESVLSTIHTTAHQTAPAQQRPTPAEDEEDDISDSFGTLSIGSDGETSYLGQTARADYLLNDSDSDDELEAGRLPSSFYNFCWPECPPPDNSIEETVLTYLPDQNEAYALSDVYLSLSDWLGFIVPREMVREDFIAHVYHLPNRPWADTIPTCPHRLALLFSIFSLGALFDPAQGPNNVQSDDYYHLARVALSFKSAVLETTTYSVLAIVHMAYILFLRDNPQEREQGWMILGVANKLALSMGLHRDSCRWKLTDGISENRHTTFWQLYVVETIASLQFGRPASLCDSMIESPIPKHINSQRAISPDGRPNYIPWLIELVRLARRIISETSGAKRKSYSSFLELDSKLRQHAEYDFQPYEYAGQDEDPTVERMRWCIDYCRDTMLLHVHRGFMLEALTERMQGKSPSKYDLSVQTCFDSSFRLIENMLWITEKYPHLSSRMTGWHGTLISSAVIMCVLIMRCPTCEIARPAMEKLDSVHAIFQKISNLNPAAKKNLQITRRLRTLARSAFDTPRLTSHGSTSPQTPHPVSLEELSALERSCGKTQLRTKKERNIEASVRRRRRDVRTTLSQGQEQLTEQQWATERANKSGEAPVPGSSGPSNWRDDSMRFGFSSAGDAVGAPFGTGIEPYWYSFMQQVGF